MALIIDPDNLNQATEIVFNTTAKTIQLLVAGNLSTDGVSGQAFYSFLKEEWKADAALIKFPFPMEAITPEQFEIKKGWTLADTTTVDLLRTCGISIKNDNGTSAEEYIGVITLGSIDSADQVYLQQEVGGSSSDIVLTGVVNQCVKVFGDITNGNFDYRSYLKVFVREQAKKYAQSSNTDIGVTTFAAQAYRFPLANSDDLKVTNNDITADAYGVTIDYTGSYVRDIGGSNFNFDVLIDGNNKTAEEIYEAVQSALRKGTDIDNGAGSVIGETTDELLTFVGDTLVTSTGVYIDNFQAADTNRIEFYDNTGTKRTFPFVAAGNLLFNANLVADADAIYRMFYSDNFGTSSAVLVDDNSAVAISGIVTGDTIAFDYDYDNDTAGGGAGIDKDVTVVAIGDDTAQYVIATGTIARTNANSISLAAALERNYSNPA